MVSATCPSCDRDLESGAVLCIGCGFDLRTGAKLQTTVSSGGPSRKRLTDEERFAGKRFNVCQLRGVSTKVEVLDENGDSADYLFSRGRLPWTLFTVVVAVPLFFLVPVGLGFLFFEVAEWAIMIIPSPGTVLTIILLTAALALKRFDVCQLQGVSTKILVSNEDGDSVAYLFSRGRPLWTLFTVVVAVPLFFLVPVGLGFLFFAVAEWAIIPTPGTVLAIILLTAAFAMGILASLLTVGLMAPRRRLKVYEDESRQRLLVQVKETWKFGVARISVIDADGRLLGRIFQHRLRNRFVLANHLDQPQAVLLSGKITYSNEWAAHSLMFTLILFLLFGLPGILLAFLPMKERDYTESFLYRVSSFEEKPTKGIGRITFNPAREDPYRIEFPDEADQSVDRRLVVALMGLMEW